MTNVQFGAGTSKMSDVIQLLYDIRLPTSFHNVQFQKIYTHPHRSSWGWGSQKPKYEVELRVGWLKPEYGYFLQHNA